MEKKSIAKKNRSTKIEIRETAHDLLLLLKQTVIKEKIYSNGDILAINKNLNNPKIAELSLTAIYGK